MTIHSNSVLGAIPSNSLFADNEFSVSVHGWRVFSLCSWMKTSQCVVMDEEFSVCVHRQHSLSCVHRMFLVNLWSWMLCFQSVFIDKESSVSVHGQHILSLCSWTTCCQSLFMDNMLSLCPWTTHSQYVSAWTAQYASMDNTLSVWMHGQSCQSISMDSAFQQHILVCSRAKGCQCVYDGH